MKYSLLLIFIILSLCFSIPVNGQDKNTLPKDTFIANLRGFPSYEEVTEYFFNRYEPISSARRHEFEFLGQSRLTINIRFAKEPNGWYVYDKKASEPGAGSIYSKQKIWDLKEAAYLDVNYLPLKNNEKALENLKQHVSESDYRLYSLHPFYGYEGWEKDIISHMKSYNNLPDSLLYGLARAYISFAVSVILNRNEQSGMNNNPTGYEKISQKRLNIFLNNLDSAFIRYRELIKQNIEYQTVNGPIALHYNNELMFAWHNLMSINEPDLAKKYLNQVNYDALTLSMAHNLLSSVSENGILFTNGDSETFALWYLQEVKQLRQDVSILNLTLLRTSYYVDMSRKLLNRDGKPNLISFEQSYIKDYKMESGIYVTKPTESYIELSDVISFLKEGKMGEFHLFVPAYKFKLKVPGKLELVRCNIIKPTDTQLVNYLEWTPRKKYFSLANIIVFDILANNNWRFPVHFSTAMGSSNYLGLEKYLNLYGLTFKLQPITSDKNQFMYGDFQINASESYKIFMNKASFKDLQASNSHDKFASKIANNIRYLTGELANKLIGYEKEELALNLLNKIEEEIQSENYPHNFFSLLIIEAYLQIGEREKALSILDFVAEAQMKRIDELTTAPAKSNDASSDQQDLRMVHFTLHQIVKLCETYELEKRYRRYNDFLQSSIQEEK